MVELKVSIPSSEIIYLNRKFNFRICLVANQSVKDIVIKCVLPEKMDVASELKGIISAKELKLSSETHPDLNYLHEGYAKTIEFPVIVKNELPVIEINIGEEGKAIDNTLNKFFEELELKARLIIEYTPLKTKKGKDDTRRKIRIRKDFIIGYPMIELLTKDSFFDEETKNFVLFVRNVGIVDAYNTNFNFNLEIFAETAFGEIELITHDFHKNVLKIMYKIPPTDIGQYKPKLKVKQKIEELDRLPSSISPSAIICNTIPSN